MKKVKDYEIKYIAKFIAPVTLRNKAGTKESIATDYFLPSDNIVIIINEDIRTSKTNGNEYIWYEALMDNGKRGWFYSGKKGGKQKIEVIGE